VSVQLSARPPTVVSCKHCLKLQIEKCEVMLNLQDSESLQRKTQTQNCDIIIVIIKAFIVAYACYKLEVYKIVLVGLIENAKTYRTQAND